MGEDKKRNVNLVSLIIYGNNDTFSVFRSFFIDPNFWSPHISGKQSPKNNVFLTITYWLYLLSLLQTLSGWSVHISFSIGLPTAPASPLELDCPPSPPIAAPLAFRWEIARPKFRWSNCWVTSSAHLQLTNWCNCKVALKIIVALTVPINIHKTDYFKAFQLKLHELPYISSSLFLSSSKSQLSAVGFSPTWMQMPLHHGQSLVYFFQTNEQLNIYLQCGHSDFCSVNHLWNKMFQRFENL